MFKRLLCALALSAAATLTASAPVSITTPDRIQFEPGKITLKVQIEPDAANRSFCVTVDSEGYTSSSCKGLDGVDAPRTTWHPFVRLPAGEYVGAVTVYGQGGGQRAQAVVPFQVLSSR